MNGFHIIIGEKKIPLRFGMDQFMEIEEQVGYLGDIKDLILKGKKRVRNIVSVIRILGNAGLKYEGQTADLTDGWLMENMDPLAIMVYQLAVMACMQRDENSQAVNEENENKERDLVLEEIERKKAPVNSQTGAYFTGDWSPVLHTRKWRI